MRLEEMSGMEEKKVHKQQAVQCSLFWENRSGREKRKEIGEEMVYKARRAFLLVVSSILSRLRKGSKIGSKSSNSRSLWLASCSNEFFNILGAGGHCVGIGIL